MYKLLVVGLLIFISFFSETVFSEEELGFGASGEIAFGTESNVLRLADNEKSDNFLEVSPEFSFIENYRKHSFSALYSGSYFTFDEFSSLNYQEHIAQVKGNFSHSLKFKTELVLRYEDTVELPGINNSLTQDVDEYNEVSRQILKLKGEYGQNTSKGQLALEYTHLGIAYNNNQQQVRDYDFNRLIMTFFYEVMPNTRMLFEVSDSSIEYTNPNSSFSSSDYQNYLIGVDWRASEKTTALIKVGQQKQNFDNQNLEDVSGLAFFADIIWQPNIFSKVQFGASRSTRESSEVNVGSFVSTDFTLDVEHEFTPKLSITSRMTIGKDDIIFTNNRTDDRQELNARLVYESNKYFDTYIGVKHYARNSDVAGFEFNNNQLIIGISSHFG